MELRDAFDQISAIRTQLAATERLRGLRAGAVALSAVVAALAAVGQTLWIVDPFAEPRLYLLLWVGAAAISALAAGLELGHRVRHSGSRLSIANAVIAAQQFSPCLVAGAAVTVFVLVRLPDHLWLLPGLWQILFGLGNLAAHRLLPRGGAAVGWLYLACGSVCLWLGELALEPWAMGLPFAAGQLALAAILWWNHERSGAAVRV